MDKTNDEKANFFKKITTKIDNFKQKVKKIIKIGIFIYVILVFLYVFLF